MRFTIVVHKDPGSSYGVTVPALPGCFSGGDTMDEAFVNAREAILLHLEVDLAAGKRVPEDQGFEAYVNDRDYAKGVWGSVDVDLADIQEDTAVRVNISVPSRVLARIDRQAKRAGRSRSAFLVESAVLQIP